jgi:hypothetical protein
VSEKYTLIDAERANYAVVKMCEWLQVSKSGYYEWCNRKASATELRREDLKAKIKQISTTATPRTATAVCTSSWPAKARRPPTSWSVS